MQFWHVAQTNHRYSRQSDPLHPRHQLGRGLPRFEINPLYRLGHLILEPRTELGRVLDGRRISL